MAETALERQHVPSVTQDSQEMSNAEFLEEFQAPPPSATEEAIEALGTDIVQRIRSAFTRGDIMLALGVVAILVVLILPMPKWLLDVSLAFSIMFSVLILMTVIFMDRSLDFNAFPTILLIATLIRLALNLASTRLILSDGGRSSPT